MKKIAPKFNLYASFLPKITLGNWWILPRLFRHELIMRGFCNEFHYLYRKNRQFMAWQIRSKSPKMIAFQVQFRIHLSKKYLLLTMCGTIYYLWSPPGTVCGSYWDRHLLAVYAIWLLVIIYSNKIYLSNLEENLEPHESSMIFFDSENTKWRVVLKSK